ncbi:hypothetical protein [Streptomyces cellulosae]|uniref:DUF4031 domain-containing protein n=1 Tax=Streptomyces cellulosae TaxID=1968 RepID=A0ABW7YIK7_STRCE
MALYVDEIKDCTAIAKLRGLRYSHWCRITADAEAELRLFATRLRLRLSAVSEPGPLWGR